MEKINRVMFLLLMFVSEQNNVVMKLIYIPKSITISIQRSCQNAQWSAELITQHYLHTAIRSSKLYNVRVGFLLIGWLFEFVSIMLHRIFIGMVCLSTMDMVQGLNISSCFSSISTTSAK